jgi:hypothetical protein
LFLKCIHVDCILFFWLIVIFKIGVYKLFELTLIIFIVWNEIFRNYLIISSQYRIFKSTIERIVFILEIISVSLCWEANFVHLIHIFLFWIQYSLKWILQRVLNAIYYSIFILNKFIFFWNFILYFLLHILFSLLM